MPFEQIPYTNFHGTNQDWMIQQIKQMIADWASYRENLDAAWAAYQSNLTGEWTDYQENLTGEWTDYQKNINSWRQAIDTAFTQLHDYVYNYFDNLDVQHEINTKLDQMAADGSLDELLLPYFNAYKTEINNIVFNQNTRITTVENEVDNFLQNTGTLGKEKDPELIDVRLGANNTTYPTAGDAVRNQFRNITNNINTFAPVSNYETFPNHFMDNEGIISTEYSFWEYMKVPVESDDVYKITAYCGLNARLWILFDNNNQIISVSSDSSALSVKTETITIPANGAYLIINHRTDSSATFSISKYVTDMILNENKIFINDLTLKTYLNQFTKTHDILEPVSNYEIFPYHYMNNEGVISPEYSFWEYVKTPVEPNTTYKVTAYAGQSARLWIVLNSNNQVITYHSDTTTPSLKTDTVTIPINGAYLVINHRTDKGANFSISKYATEEILNDNKIFIDNVKLKDYLNTINNSILDGKILCCVGDSITYGADMPPEGIAETSDIIMYQWNDSNKTWDNVQSNVRMTYGYQIAKRNNMVFYNGGISGSTMQGITERSGFSLPDGRYTKLPDNIDYLLIWFGWNDAAYGTLGEITDSTNNTYYGAYNVVLPYLIDKYPYTKIMLVVPYGTTAGHREAIRQLGNKWGLAVWDNYKGGTPLYYGKEENVGVDPTIITENREKFQAIGAHPNYNGHKQLGDMIEHFIKGI